jgi:hypothetical protein
MGCEALERLDNIAEDETAVSAPSMLFAFHLVKLIIRKLWKGMTKI